MQLLCPLVGGLILLVVPSAAVAQIDLTSPERAVASYLVALESQNWERAADLLHPGELRRFSETLDLNFRLFSNPDSFITSAGLHDAPDREALRQMLALHSLKPDQLADYFPGQQHYDELSESQKFIAYFRYSAEEAHAPFLYDFQWDTRVLGAVAESDTLSHTVVKQIISIAETRDGKIIARSSYDALLVISASFDGDNWRPHLGDHVFGAVAEHFTRVAIGPPR